LTLRLPKKERKKGKKKNHEGRRRKYSLTLAGRLSHAIELIRTTLLHEEEEEEVRKKGRKERRKGESPSRPIRPSFWPGQLKEREEPLTIQAASHCWSKGRGKGGQGKKGKGGEKVTSMRQVEPAREEARKGKRNRKDQLTPCRSGGSSSSGK